MIAREEDPRRILVFRIGQLGDQMVAVPSFHVVRRRYPKAHIALLCDRQVGRAYVLAPDLLRGSGLFDEFIFYPFDPSRSGRLARPWSLLALLLRLRARRFDTLVYLAPNLRSAAHVARDRRYFRLAGIRRLIGLEGFTSVPVKAPAEPLPALPSEADVLLSRLRASGLQVPRAGEGNMDLNLGAAEERAVQTWLAGQKSDRGRPWIGIGPGSKMPAKIWPEDRYRAVVASLIQEFDVWPVVVGGPEDRARGERLLSAWGRGYNAAGTLELRPAAAALRRCALYLGNDSGAMHLAASSGTRCIAIFSSREAPGSWFPYGQGHRIFRTPIDCEGCMLQECVERRMECIMTISPERVLDACREELLKLRSGGTDAARAKNITS